jgi:hypothetical protein
MRKLLLFLAVAISGLFLTATQSNAYDSTYPGAEAYAQAVQNGTYNPNWNNWQNWNNHNWQAQPMAYNTTMYNNNWNNNGVPNMYKYPNTTTSYNTNTRMNAPVANTVSYAGYNSPNIVQRAPSQFTQAYNLQTGQNTGVTTYLQNVTPTDITTTLCANETVGGRSYNIGCQPTVPFASAANGPSTFDINVWPSPALSQMGGTHSIHWTYWDATSNSWREIGTPWYTQARTMYSY